MNSKQFFELVEKMRNKQKEYFRTHDRSVLAESIKIEGEIDTEIKRVNDILKTK